MLMQRTLQENGVPIPKILGFCSEPLTIVMEFVRGGRDPGLMQQAIENPSEMTPDRWQASLRYMEILAEMHPIPPERFVAAGRSSLPILNSSRWAISSDFMR
jgi:aminoglycoside phosphotransferase (APT) family kinase protein